MIIAQEARASEIGISHLLAAIHAPKAPLAPFASDPSKPLVPVERQDMPLSVPAASVIASLGDVFSISVEALEQALLAANCEGLE